MRERDAEYWAALLFEAHEPDGPARGPLTCYECHARVDRLGNHLERPSYGGRGHGGQRSGAPGVRYCRAEAKARAHGSKQYVGRHSIFKRDGWMCQICFRPVNPELKWPDPDSATLDHIVPFSLGGEHTRENVRLAHARCNGHHFWRGGQQFTDRT